MMKKAIGALALLVIVAGLTAPAAAIEGNWGWIYISTSSDHYKCNDDGVAWDGAERSIYILLETPAASWGTSDAYLGIEYGMDYPASLFILSKTSPDAPAPLFFGDCASGHCSIQIGYGGGTHKNPNIATEFRIVTFGQTPNLAFSLAPVDNPSQGATTPAWILESDNPPVYGTEAGDGTAVHPGWQQGFVVLNYDQATAPATVFPPNQDGSDWPLFNAGDPCLRAKVIPTSESTWGALKAGY